jgi:hypothetical protein
MKVTALYFVAPCSLVKVNDVSEVLTAPVIRAIALFDAGSFEETSRH